MSKYIVEIPDYVPFVLLREEVHGKFITKVVPTAELEELNSDYINEHFGELQDEAYQKGFEDGKKSVSEPDRIEVGDIVDVYGKIGVVTYAYKNTFNVMMYDGSTGRWRREDLKKTGKHYDIQSILEAMKS